MSEKTLWERVVEEGQSEQLGSVERWLRAVSIAKDGDVEIEQLRRDVAGWKESAREHLNRRDVASAERDNARAEVDRLMSDLRRTITAANVAGWNGVDNPKSLWDFVQQLGEERRVARAEVEQLKAQLAAKPTGWTCFHCRRHFSDEESARKHFGPTEVELEHAGISVDGPECQLKLEDVQQMDYDLSRYRAEDSDKDRQIASMSADHAAALRRAEEDGYANGLAAKPVIQTELAPAQRPFVPSAETILQAEHFDKVNRGEATCGCEAGSLHGIELLRSIARDIAKQDAGKACHCDEEDLAAAKVRRETCPVHGAGKDTDHG